MKEFVTLDKGIAKLNLKVSNGVYMVNITNSNTGERVIKKLVINK